MMYNSALGTWRVRLLYRVCRVRERETSSWNYIGIDSLVLVNSCVLITAKMSNHA